MADLKNCICIPAIQAKRDVLVVAETMASLTYLRPIIHNLLIDGVSANVEARSSLSQLPVSWLTRSTSTQGSLLAVHLRVSLLTEKSTWKVNLKIWSEDVISSLEL